MDGKGRDVWLHEIVEKESVQCEPKWVSAEHPLFILYTSGSTGKQKGVQHSTAGVLLWAAQTMKWTFDMKSRDMSFGVWWISAGSRGIATLRMGRWRLARRRSCSKACRRTRTRAASGSFWEMIARHKITIFYTAPTAIRSLIKASEADAKVHLKSFDLSTLRILGTVGEPINPEAWMWYHENDVGGGKCPIVDTWWQTETGGHMITPLPGATPLVPGSCPLPLPGIMATIVDETGQDVPNGQGDILIVKRPWPSMLCTVGGDPKRYQTSYFPEELGDRLYCEGRGDHAGPVHAGESRDSRPTRRGALSRFIGIEFSIGIFCGLAGILVCSFLGGMRAVTWTQVAQYIILIAAMLIPLSMDRAS